MVIFRGMADNDTSENEQDLSNSCIKEQASHNEKQRKGKKRENKGKKESLKWIIRV